MSGRNFGYRSTAFEVIEGIDLSAKTTIVTGGLGGIGIETSRALAKAGATVIITARDVAKAQPSIDSLRESTNNPRIFALELDLGNFLSIRSFVNEFKRRFSDLHILILNAAVMATPYGKTVNGFETQFGTNHLGHFLLTNLLVPTLVASAPARVVALSSIAHKRPVAEGIMGINFDDIQFERSYDKWSSYAQSKTANVLFAVELNRRLQSYGVTANAVHPGGIMTNLQRHMDQDEIRQRGWVDEEGKVNDKFKTPEEGASTSIYVATAPELEGQGGHYFEDCHRSEINDSPMTVMPCGVGSWALDPEIARRLWDLSEVMVGEKFDFNWISRPRVSGQRKGLVVITGASSGIGKAAAEKFAQEGHPLLLLARRKERMEALGLPNTLVRQVDVTDRQAMAEAVREAEGVYGPVDVLINNAGVMLLGSIDTQSPMEWETMMNVNVLGILNGIKAVIDSMKQRKNGTIINISSLAGKKTFDLASAYCASKFAVHALSEGIRAEVGQHSIRCIVIAPGAVETELLSHTTNEAIVNNFVNAKKAGLLASLVPDDLADACYYVYNQPQRECIRELVIAPTFSK